MLHARTARFDVMGTVAFFFEVEVETKHALGRETCEGQKVTCLPPSHAAVALVLLFCPGKTIVLYDRARLPRSVINYNIAL